MVSVKVGDRAQSKLGVDALLDFSVGVTLDGQALTEDELQAILQSAGGLISLRGKWEAFASALAAADAPPEILRHSRRL